MFNYLRAKYKNIFIVTHKSEVRDYVDNIIEVKKIEAKNASPRELYLLRTFANYNFQYLSQLVEPSKYKEVITKSKECYKLILSKITALLKSF